MEAAKGHQIGMLRRFRLNCITNVDQTPSSTIAQHHYKSKCAVHCGCKGGSSGRSVLFSSPYLLMGSFMSSHWLVFGGWENGSPFWKSWSMIDTLVCFQKMHGFDEPTMIHWVLG